MQNYVLRLSIQADKLFYMAAWPHRQKESLIEAVSRMRFWMVTLIFFAYYTTWKLVLPLQKCYFDIWHALGRHFRTPRCSSCDFLCPWLRILHALDWYFSMCSCFFCVFSVHIIVFNILWADFSARSGAFSVFFSAHRIVFHMPWTDISAHSGAFPAVFSAHGIIYAMPQADILADMAGIASSPALNN